MFCEKCGNKLNDGEIFCEKCGTPVPTPVENAVNAPPQTNPAAYQVAQTNETVNNTAQPAAPQKPKQPMSPKTKKIILFSSIGAGVVAIALIVLFAVVLPILNRVNVAEYIKVSFDEDMLYENHATAYFSIDSDRIYEDYLDDGKSTKEKFKDKLDDYSSYSDLDSLLDGLGSDFASDAGISTILSHCDISVELKDDKKETEASSSSLEDDYYESDTSTTLENLKSDDVAVVTLTWDKDEDSIREVKRAEKAAGISFDTSDKTVEIKISDELKKDDLSLSKTQDVDILSYIEENNLTHTIGIKNGDLYFRIKDFTYEVGEYTLTYEAEDSYSRTVDITDNSGTEYGSFEIYYSDINTNLYDGDTVELNVDGIHIENTSLFITDSSKTFTVTANEPLNAETAKSNLDIIKSTFNEMVNDEDNYIFDDWENISVSDVYFLEKKDDYADYENAVVVVYKGTYDGYFSSSTRYNTFTFTNTYIDGEDFIYSNTDNGYSDEKLKDLEKYDRWLSTDSYTKTKIS